MAKNTKTNKKQAAVKKTSFFGGVVNFFKGVNVELKKVSWPTKQELINYTMIVIAMVTMIAIIVWVLDTGLGYLRGLL